MSGRDGEDNILDLCAERLRRSGVAAVGDAPLIAADEAFFVIVHRFKGIGTKAGIELAETKVVALTERDNDAAKPVQRRDFELADDGAGYDEDDDGYGEIDDWDGEDDDHGGSDDGGGGDDGPGSGYFRGYRPERPKSKWKRFLGLLGNVVREYVWKPSNKLMLSATAFVLVVGFLFMFVIPSSNQVANDGRDLPRIVSPIPEPTMMRESDRQGPLLQVEGVPRLRRLEPGELSRLQGRWIVDPIEWDGEQRFIDRSLPPNPDAVRVPHPRVSEGKVIDRVVDLPEQARVIDLIAGQFGLPTRNIVLHDDLVHEADTVSPALWTVGAEGSVVDAIPRTRSSLADLGWLVFILMAAAFGTGLVRMQRHMAHEYFGHDDRGVRWGGGLTCLAACLIAYWALAGSWLSIALGAAALMTVGGHVATKYRALLGAFVIYLLATIALIPVGVRPVAALEGAYGQAGIYGWDMVFMGALVLLCLFACMIPRRA